MHSTDCPTYPIFNPKIQHFQAKQWLLITAKGFISLWIFLWMIINRYKYPVYTPDNFLWFLYDGLIYFIPGSIFMITPLKYMYQLNIIIEIIHTFIFGIWLAYTTTKRLSIEIINLPQILMKSVNIVNCILFLMRLIYFNYLSTQVTIQINRQR